MKTSRRPVSPCSSTALVFAGSLSLILFPGNLAKAAFHFWNVSEVYSSADGKVQFIELQALGGGQQNLGTFGAVIRSTNALGTSSFTCPSNLPSDTFNKTCILGTSNLLSTPGGVTPDYIIPANFIRAPVPGSSAAVIFNPSGNAISYASLPTDGSSSVASGGGIVVNSPKNFNNQSNSIVPVKFLSGSQLDGTNVVLTFKTATGPNNSAGPNYTIEYKDIIDAVNWTSNSAVAGDGTIRSVTNYAGDSMQRFYRLRVP